MSVVWWVCGCLPRVHVYVMHELVVPGLYQQSRLHFLVLCYYCYCSISSESLANTAASTDLLPYVSNVSTSLKRVFQDGQVSDTANITHLQDFEQDTKALIQETLWFLNMQKVSLTYEVEMRQHVHEVEAKMRKIVSTNLSECVSEMLVDNVSFMWGFSSNGRALA